MPAERFFLDSFLSENEILLMPEEESHHIQVMRHQKGDFIELVNGQNQLALTQISQIQNKKVYLKILKVQSFPETKHKIIIAQALPKLNRLDTIIEKCTELDVYAIWLFPGDHSEKKEINDHQKERIKKITIAAMKQSGRLTLPSIDYKPSLSKWNSNCVPDCSFFGDVDPKAPPFKNHLPFLGNHCLFFVGPESGFSENEEALLRSWNVLGVKLHHHILRTDTAPIVAMSIMQHFRLD